MLGERTPEGWQARLKPKGIGRYFSAAFLIFWIVGWAIGEGFAVWLLANGVLALMNGIPLGNGQEPLKVGTAMLVGGFLLVWLLFWTLGGIAAIAQVLRLLWSEDRLLAHAGGVSVIRSREPFRWRREIPREAIRRIFLIPKCQAITAETGRERIELSGLGTLAEREQVAAALRAELGVSEPAVESVPALLPIGWEEIVTPEGGRAITQSLATRRTQSRVAGLLAAVVATMGVALFLQASAEPSWLPMAILVTLGASGLAWGAIRLARGRTEWLVGNGRVTLLSRYGACAKDLFEATRLAIVTSTDSDGDDWYYLEAYGVSQGMEAVGNPHTRRRVASSMNDPTVPRRLGIWLSRSASVPIEDRGTRAAREAELAQLQAQLESSGPIGRAAARFLRGAIDRQRDRT